MKKHYKKMEQASLDTYSIMTILISLFIKIVKRYFLCFAHELNQIIYIYIYI